MTAVPPKPEHVLSSAPARRLLGGRAGALFTAAGAGALFTAAGAGALFAAAGAGALRTAARAGALLTAAELTRYSRPRS